MAKHIWLARHWRTPRSLHFILFGIELAFTIAALALFGIADPDLYRSKLQEGGFQSGFNSGKTTLLLQYANHVQVNVPLVWSAFITTFNLVISVISTFFLLVKAILFVLGTWYPLLSFLAHAALAALYAYSIYGQLGPDLSDPVRPQSGPPWYITKGCGVVSDVRLVGYCHQAQACLAITIILIAIFLAHMILASLSIKPSAAEVFDRQTHVDGNDFEAPYCHNEENMNHMANPPDTTTLCAGAQHSLGAQSMPRKQQFADEAKGNPSTELSTIDRNQP